MVPKTMNMIKVRNAKLLWLHTTVELENSELNLKNNMKLKEKYIGIMLFIIYGVYDML